MDASSKESKLTEDLSRLNRPLGTTGAQSAAGNKVYSAGGGTSRLKIADSLLDSTKDSHFSGE